MTRTTKETDRRVAAGAGAPLARVVVEPASGAGEGVRCHTLGVPLARGALQPGEAVCWRAPDDTTAPAQSRPLSRWPDGSVRWLLCDLLRPVGAGSAEERTLERGATEPPSGGVAVGSARQGACAVRAGRLTFRLERGAALVGALHRDGLEVAGPLRATLVDGQGVERPARVESVAPQEEGPLRAALEIAGRFEGSPLCFRARIEVWHGADHLRVDLAVHHPEPAAHRGGCWDLGDAHSAWVRGVRLTCARPAAADDTDAEVRAADARVRWTVDGGAALPEADALPLRIEQASSGGDRWDSRNHVDGDGEVPLPYRGFRVESGGKEVARGDRARPWVALGPAVGAGPWLALGLVDFWQHFPLRLAADGQRVEAELLAAPQDNPIELQGGERKTFRLRLGAVDDPAAFAAALEPERVRVAPESVVASGVLRQLVPRPSAGRWWELVRGAIEGPHAFVGKREKVDEYGWRHFGELFADHEAVNSDPAAPLASHYNNQYDPIYAFLRRYLASGDARWLELADDLARHVRDIDVYHTKRDREEYDGGLFWHTDHYLDAGTCTHRAFSRAHAEIKGQTGGGHSLEHCYARGLALHHFLTGEPASREVALSLAEWVLRVQNGPSTLLGTLHRLRRHRGALKAWLGFRRPAHYRCPLNRGTGNSVHTVLDAWLLTGEDRWVREAGWLIRNCAGPRDDVDARALLDVEANWSYTVFLDAVCRYLEVQVERGVEDGPEAADAGHASALLAHYVRWMVAHERTYLEQIEQLEFPNETWPAQDLRKARVLRNAARWLPADEAAAACRRGRELFDRAIEQLYTFPEEKRHLTRPVVLVLQNCEPFAEEQAESEPAGRGDGPDAPGGPASWADPGLPTPTFGRYLREQLGHALRHTSPAKELRWLRTRIRNARP